MTNGVVSAHKERITDVREITESDGIVVMENRKFTNTALPVFSGAEGWYQHIHIVQAIVKSNGWPDETSNTDLDQQPSGHPAPVSRMLDKEMRPAQDIRSVPGRNCDVRARGVQEPIVSPLSPLAESFTPRPTLKE